MNWGAGDYGQGEWKRRGDYLKSWIEREGKVRWEKVFNSLIWKRECLVIAAPLVRGVGLPAAPLGKHVISANRVQRTLPSPSSAPFSKFYLRQFPLSLLLLQSLVSRAREREKEVFSPLPPSVHKGNCPFERRGETLARLNCRRQKRVFRGREVREKRTL